MKPILFSTPMVRAILTGQKTMTRRVCKPLTLNYPAHTYLNETPEQWLDRWNHKPPYQPGDILWVRETWADLRGMGFGNDPNTDKPWLYAFKADIKPGSDSDRTRIDYGVKWRPSIHMPREAARIFLRVTDVRVERLQEISEEDAAKEGLAPAILDGAVFISAKGKFRVLWETINAKRGYGWDTNPWVWVISFDRCEKPEEI